MSQHVAAKTVQTNSRWAKWANRLFRGVLRTGRRNVELDAYRDILGLSREHVRPNESEPKTEQTYNQWEDWANRLFKGVLRTGRRDRELDAYRDILRIGDQAATPAFIPDGAYFASSQVVTITTATEGARILYTTNGSPPSIVNGLEYSGSVGVTETTTIQAVAIKAGMMQSTSASATFTKMTAVATPTLTPAAEFVNSMAVTMACSTPGATIYYTADGSTPSDQSTEYTGPVTITSSATLKAIAVATNMIPSQVASVSYTQTSGEEFVYWGKSAEAQASGAQIAALLSTPKTSPAGTYHFSSTSDQMYCYFAVPEEWTGPTAIMLGAFEWGIARTAPYDTTFGSLKCRVLTIAGVPCRVFRSQYTTAGDLLLTVS